MIINSGEFWIYLWKTCTIQLSKQIGLVIFLCGRLSFLVFSTSLFKFCGVACEDCRMQGTSDFLTISACRFQEWVTDTPFIISPRITFEVSVRLLGGLMALGYTIATILKRSSHAFSNDRVCVKIDWLEQLNRQYIQVLYKILNSFVRIDPLSIFVPADPAKSFCFKFLN